MWSGIHVPGSIFRLMFRREALLHILMYVLPHVPPALAYRLCSYAGLLAPYLPVWPAVVANMQHVRPAADRDEVEALARSVCINLFKNYYDLLRAHALRPEELEASCEIEGLENVRRALARGKGAIVVTLHTGSYSLAFEPVGRALDIDILVVVEQMSNQAIHSLLNRLRRREHVQIVAVGPEVTRTIMQTLRRGGIVVMAQDRLVAGASSRGIFFGTPADLPIGPALLALRTGAMLLPVYVSRRPNNQMRIVIDPPIKAATGPTRVRAIDTTKAALLRVLEGYIRAAPAQWLLTNAVWTSS